MFDPEQNHMTLWAFERRSEIGDVRWERWHDKVCQTVGLEHLDGTQSIDGYSMDYAFRAYRDGQTAQQYADSIS